MDKAEMEALLNQQMVGLADYSNGFRACAKAVLEAFEKKEKDATGIEANAGNS